MFQFKIFSLKLALRKKLHMSQKSYKHKHKTEVKINLIISEDNNENVIFHKPIFIIFFFI